MPIRMIKPLTANISDGPPDAVCLEVTEGVAGGGGAASSSASVDRVRVGWPTGTVTAG
jgi:hypothetical protein